LPGAKITLRPSSAISLYWQHYCTALQQTASAKLCGVVQGMELQNFRKGRHLYSAGQPSCWASAHILVPYLTARTEQEKKKNKIAGKNYKMVK